MAGCGVTGSGASGSPTWRTVKSGIERPPDEASLKAQPAISGAGTPPPHPRRASKATPANTSTVPAAIPGVKGSPRKRMAMASVLIGPSMPT